MPYEPTYIAKRIRALAKACGSQRALADKAGVDPKTIRNAIGNAHGMTLSTAIQIAEGGGIKVADLIGENPRTDQETHDLLSRLTALVERFEEMADRGQVEARPRRAPRSAKKNR